jgi:hypothetical protein
LPQVSQQSGIVNCPKDLATPSVEEVGEVGLAGNAMPALLD